MYGAVGSRSTTLAAVDGSPLNLPMLSSMPVIHSAPSITCAARIGVLVIDEDEPCWNNPLGPKIQNALPSAVAAPRTRAPSAVVVRDVSILPLASMTPIVRAAVLLSTAVVPGATA